VFYVQYTDSDGMCNPRAELGPKEPGFDAEKVEKLFLSGRTRRAAGPLLVAVLECQNSLFAYSSSSTLALIAPGTGSHWPSWLTHVGNHRKETTMPFVMVKMIEGRSVEQKRRLVKELTNVVVKYTGVTEDQVHVVIEDYAKENWAAGGVLLADK
jgi:4-oxalocrotonate tautomerase